MTLWRALILAAVTALVFVSSSECGWYTFTETDGLVSRDVVTIEEDGSGNLWFGTRASGVSQYNGIGWRTYTATYTAADGLASDYMHAILEDGSGNLWFATSNGLSRYDGESWRTYTTADGLASTSMTAILEDGSGNLWFGTRGGVSRFDGEGWSTFTAADGLAEDDVRAIEEDSSGNLWFGTWAGGVTRYDGESWRTYTTVDGLANNYVNAILEDESGNLWFGTGNGVSRYDGEGWSTFTTADGLASNEVHAILEDRFGNLWFGTWSVGGVSRYDGESWCTFSTADGLASDHVNAILEDSSGNLWFGTAGGVSLYDGESWCTFSTADGLAENYVYAIEEDSSCDLWFGTWGGGGVSRYDGESWRTFTTADGLASNYVNAILEDNSGNLWFATQASGVSQYNGTSWSTFTTVDGLASDYVNTILEDSSGNLWFGTADGASRYDGEGWSTFTTADGLAEHRVYAILEDSSGDLWFGTWGGVSRYDGEVWSTFRRADGLASDRVTAIEEDRSGDLWIGTWDGGVSCYDGEAWNTYTTADGLASDHVNAILEDRSGDLWFGTGGEGVSRYDGVNWGTYASSDGLSSSGVNVVLEDCSGNLWFGTMAGVTRHEPDRISPQTVISPKPPELSTSTIANITFGAAFREVEGIRFSHSFDGTPWSEWSPTNFYQAVSLSDGEHVFMVRARDRIGNVDSTPAVSTFEIDAAPPAPVISFPSFGLVVRESIDIRGTAADLRFEKYRVEVRAAGSASWDSLAESTSPVTQGALAGWNTVLLPDGGYELRLSVTDTLGLTGTSHVTVTVDNHAPWAHETAPAVVSASAGGDIYTTDGGVHLYFPPHAFALDAEVDIFALSDSLVPDTLVDGAVCLMPGYDISWEGALLEKAATVELSYSGASSPLPDGQLSLYVFGQDSTWQRLGGTVEGAVRRVSSPITKSGRYAVFVETAVMPGVATLSAVSIIPRVFSPRGTFAREEVGIGFTLGCSGFVTVKVYNRAGRLVREVLSSESMGAGANLVCWDGRDRNGEIVVDGLYLISVEGLGEKEVKTIAVVR